MASRPTTTRKSKSTTSTQRKQNLLRSVYLSGSRYLTNGRYRLTPNTLTLVNDNNRAYPGAYFILRADLRRVLADNLEEIGTYYHAGSAKTAFSVNVTGEDFIQIGCKTFRGKDAVALHEWAFNRKN